MIAKAQQFGWAGIYEEEKAFDHLYQYGDCFVEFDEYTRQQRNYRQDAIVRARSEMPFDNGWCFWHGVNKVYGAQVQPGAQNIGNCVGYSAILSCVDLQAQEILIDGDLENAFVPTVLFSYGAGRVLVNGGRSPIRGDGSIGSWQAKADSEFGFLDASLPGLPDAPANEIQEPYSAETGRVWGRSATVLREWAPKAKDHTVMHSARLQSADETKKSVTELFRPFTIASSWAFRPKGFDPKYGIMIYTRDRGGRWDHQMHGRAVFEIKGQWFVYIGNQWGLRAHKDVGEGFPRGGFVITIEEYAQWVREAAVYARGGFKGRSTEIGPSI